jgi:SPP1 family predicted phage head-tail adaptor
MSVFTSLLNHDFTKFRRRRTPDGQGGWAVDYVSVETVRGRLRPASSSEREAAAREERQVTHVFYCDAGEDITRGDRLSYSGLTVDEEGVREPSLAGEHLEIDCLEIQAETNLEDGS